MPSALNTGVPLAGGRVNSPGYELQSANTYFDVNSSDTVSHFLDVTEVPILIRAFFLSSTWQVNVYMSTVRSNGAEIRWPLVINGRLVALTVNNTALVLDMPGRYRLELTGGLGIVTVVAQETAMSFWSWNLSAYANALDQSNNSQNPTPAE